MIQDVLNGTGFFEEDKLLNLAASETEPPSNSDSNHVLEQNENFDVEQSLKKLDKLQTGERKVKDLLKTIDKRDESDREDSSEDNLSEISSDYDSDSDSVLSRDEIEKLIEERRHQIYSSESDTSFSNYDSENSYLSDSGRSSFSSFSSSSGSEGCGSNMSCRSSEVSYDSSNSSIDGINTSL